MDNALEETFFLITFFLISISIHVFRIGRVRIRAAAVVSIRDSVPHTVELGQDVAMSCFSCDNDGNVLSDVLGKGEEESTEGGTPVLGVFGHETLEPFLGKFSFPLLGHGVLDCDQVHKLFDDIIFVVGKCSLLELWKLEKGFARALCPLDKRERKSFFGVGPAVFRTGDGHCSLEKCGLKRKKVEKGGQEGSLSLVF